MEALLALNNLSDPSALAVGQVLLLPGAEEESATPVAPTPTPTSPDTGQGTDPGTIRQPGPDEVVTDVPDRPDAFRDYGAAALPWLHTRTQVDEIIPLFEEWGMPPVPGECCRLNLIDTDLDGLFSVVIIYTDPRTFSDPIGVGTYLVIYDPIPERPDRYRIAYDHIIRTGGSSLGIQVFDQGDVTGDGQRDVVYIEELCGASTCTTTVHVLVRDGSGYREIADPPVQIPTKASFAVEDATNDGWPTSPPKAAPTDPSARVRRAPSATARASTAGPSHWLARRGWRRTGGSGPR